MKKMKRLIGIVEKNDLVYPLSISILYFIIITVLSIFFRYPQNDELVYLHGTTVTTESIRNLSFITNPIDAGWHGFLLKLPPAIIFLISGPIALIPTLFNVLLGALSIYFFYFILLHFLKSKHWSALGTIMFACTYRMIFEAPTFLHDVPSVFAVIILLYFIIKNKKLFWISFGLLLVINAKGYVFFMIIPSIVAWVMYLFFTEKSQFIIKLKNFLLNIFIIFSLPVLWLCLTFTTPLFPFDINNANILGLSLEKKGLMDFVLGRINPAWATKDMHDGFSLLETDENTKSVDTIIQQRKIAIINEKSDQTKEIREEVAYNNILQSSFQVRKLNDNFIDSTIYVKEELDLFVFNKEEKRVDNTIKNKTFNNSPKPNNKLVRKPRIIKIIPAKKKRNDTLIEFKPPNVVALKNNIDKKENKPTTLGKLISEKKNEDTTHKKTTVKKKDEVKPILKKIEKTNVVNKDAVKPILKKIEKTNIENSNRIENKANIININDDSLKNANKNNKNAYNDSSAKLSDVNNITQNEITHKSDTIYKDENLGELQNSTTDTTSIEKSKVSTTNNNSKNKPIKENSNELLNSEEKYKERKNNTILKPVEVKKQTITEKKEEKELKQKSISDEDVTQVLEIRKDRTNTIIDYFLAYLNKITSRRTFSFISIPIFFVVLSLVWSFSRFKEYFKNKEIIFIVMFNALFIIIYIVANSYARYLMQGIPFIIIISMLAFKEAVRNNKILVIALVLSLPLTVLTLFQEFHSVLIKSLGYITIFVPLIFIPFVNKSIRFRRYLIVLSIMCFSFFSLATALFAYFNADFAQGYRSTTYPGREEFYKEISRYFNRNENYLIYGIDDYLIRFYLMDERSNFPNYLAVRYTLKEFVPLKYNIIPYQFAINANGNYLFDSSYVFNNFTTKIAVVVDENIIKQNRFDKVISHPYLQSQANLPNWLELEQFFETKSRKFYLLNVNFKIQI